MAALNDTDFFKKTIDHNTMVRDKCTRSLGDMGLTVYPSEGNFLLVDFKTPGLAEGCRLALKNEGILVRQVGSYGLPSCLRISLGTDEEMALALAGIKVYMNNQ